MEGDKTEKSRAPRSRITELASIIQSRTEEINAYLSERGLPLPSFDVDTPDDLPEELHPAQHALLEASDELTALIQGPRQSLATLATEHNKAMSTHGIIRFKLAEAFPLTSTITFPELAETTGLAEEDIVRILRHAMTYRIFSEPSPGVIAHTAASRLLATSPNLSNFIEISLDELLPSASRMVDAMQRWPSSQEPNEAGFNIANNTSDPMFAVMDKDPNRAMRFAGSMKGFLDSPAFSPKHLIEGYDWDSVGKVVDVGGSGGAIAVELARKFEGLRCVVQDLPKAIATASVPEELKDRIELVPHDVFEKQMVLDADVYLIRFMLHDWSDKYAAKILKGLVPALESGTGKRIVINDTCLPDWGTMGLVDQRFLRVMSLTMKAIQNGKERDAKDWERVLHLADPRLELTEVRRLPGSALSVLLVNIAKGP